MAYTVNGSMRRVVTVGGGEEHGEPALDDPATGGALAALLGAQAWRISHDGHSWIADISCGAVGDRTTAHRSLGRACFGVAIALGRWS